MVSQAGCGGVSNTSKVAFTAGVDSEIVGMKCVKRVCGGEEEAVCAERRAWKDVRR